MVDRVIVPEQPDVLRENDAVVTALRTSIYQGTDGLGTAIKAIKRVLKEGCWRDRIDRRTGNRVTFERFAEFMSTPPLEGLGTDARTLRNLLRDDPEALDLLDQATQNSASIHLTAVDNIHGSERPAGTSRDAALRRLRKDRPDLHARVLTGELTPHGAMVQAGFRRPVISVRTDDPERLAASLRRHLDPTALARLAELLSEP